MEEACFVKGKMERGRAIKAVKMETLEAFRDSLTEEGDGKLFDGLMEDLEQEIVRKSILDRKVRTDGRSPTDIRPISCEVDFFREPTVRRCLPGVKPSRSAS